MRFVVIERSSVFTFQFFSWNARYLKYDLIKKTQNLCDTFNVSRVLRERLNLLLQSYHNFCAKKAFFLEIIDNKACVLGRQIRYSGSKVPVKSRDKKFKSVKICERSRTKIRLVRNFQSFWKKDVWKFLASVYRDSYNWALALTFNRTKLGWKNVWLSLS